MEPSSQDVLSESAALEPVALEPEPVEPSEAVVIKKPRGRPKGSLNKKTIERMKEPLHILDVDFNSDEVLGETPPTPVPKRKAKPKPPPSPSSSEEEDEDVTPSPPPRLKRATTRSRTYEVDEQRLNPPSYLEILSRGLKEAKAQQHAEKVAQYDRFFAW